MLLLKDINNKIRVYDTFDDSLVSEFCHDNETSTVYLDDTMYKFDFIEQYIAIGSNRGKVYIWDINKGNISNRLNYHNKNSYCTKFSEKLKMLTTTCKDIAIWKY